MTCRVENKPDAYLSSEKFLGTGEVNEAPVTADLALAADTLLPTSKNQPLVPDYSEEAIPERDPAYQLSDATFSQTQTVAHVSPADRLALARCLEQLGMRRTRAALVASL
jgi:hypothetical protein